MRRRYPTDLSDAEWRCIEPYITSPNRRGRPRKDIWFAPRPRRCLLRLEERLRLATVLPREFPPWRTVYYWFRRRWRIEGTFERLNAVLCASECEYFRVETPNPAQG